LEKIQFDKNNFPHLFECIAFTIDSNYTPRYDDVAVKGFDTVAYFTENAADKYWPGLFAEN